MSPSHTLFSILKTLSHFSKLCCAVFREEAHAVPVDQGRFVRHRLPHHLRGTTFAALKSLEMSFITFLPTMPAFTIGPGTVYASLFQDAEGSVQLLIGTETRGLSAIASQPLQLATDRHTDPRKH